MATHSSLGNYTDREAWWAKFAGVEIVGFKGRGMGLGRGKKIYPGLTGVPGAEGIPRTRKKKQME